MASDDPPDELPVIPDGTYTDREEFARGGLGRVLRATDRSMGRIVAIKELLPGSEVDEARFIREALVTGRLEHPSIVPVYEAGRWPSGEPFYTMKLVSGRPLKDVVKEAGSLAERLALVPKVIAVAEAMAYAHSKHVIHRDIKPSNVIIGQFGETVVIDWGLAKELGVPDAEGPMPTGPLRGDELTSFGDVLGTPAYMAPEQAHGLTVDERADVYALGALLYFVLSAAAPHEPVTSAAPASPPEVVREAETNGDAHDRSVAVDMTGTDILSRARRPPVPLETRRPDAPQELLAIVHKAMARDPDDRYPTAKEFAEDLTAFQTGRLVSAHHYTPWALLRRWLHRNRVVVGVTAAAATLLLVGLAISVARIVDARDEAVVARTAEGEARQQAERRSHDLVLLQARASLPRDPTAALAWLHTYPLSAPGWDAARGIVAEALARGVSSDVWRVAEGGTNAVRYAPDGKTLAVIGGDGVVRVLDAGARAWRKLGSVGSDGGALALSPDGKTLAAGGDDRAVVLFAFAGGAPRPIGSHDDAVVGVAFSPDGRLVASTSMDRTVRIFSVDGGPARVLRGHELATTGLAFSPDGVQLATGSEDSTMRLWDVASGQLLRTLKTDRSVLDIAFAPDGRRIAAATRNGVRVWDMQSGTDEARILGERRWGETYAVAWGRSGLLVTGGVDGLGVWDRSLSSARWLIGHDGAVSTVAIAPNGTGIVSGGQDGTIRLWPLRRDAGESLREGNQPAGTGARPRVTDAGRLIVAPGEDGSILLARGRDKITQLRGHVGPVREVLASPDGATLVSYGLDRTVRLWDVAAGTGRLVATLPVQAFRLRWAAGGRHIAWTQGFEELVIYDLQAGAVSCVFRGHNDSASEISPDGKTIAYVDNYDVMLGDLASCKTHKAFAHRGSVFNFAWRSDSAELAAASSDRTVGVISLGRDASPRFLRGHDKGVYAVAFAPDGRSVASVSFDGVARVFDAAGGPARLTLRGHEKALLFLAFTPDGRLLATSGADDTVRVWDLAAGDLVQRESDTGGGGLAISPDGAWIVSAGVRGVRRWPLDRRDALPRVPAELLAAIDAATHARVDEAGRLESP